MKLRWLTILLGIAISFSSAHAQVGIYGKLDSVRFTAAGVGSPRTTTWFYGPGAGVYYDFLHLGPIALGADLRGNVLWGSQQRYRSALFGLRLAANPPLLPIRPYIQASIGAGGAGHTGGLFGPGFVYSTKFQYQVLGGVDFTIFPHLDLRLAELGYGRMSGIDSGPASVFSLGSGIVVRLP